MIEPLAITLLYVAGAALLHALGLRDKWPLMALALPIGAAIYVAVGMLSAALPVFIPPWAVLIASTVAVTASAAHTGHGRVVLTVCSEHLGLWIAISSMGIFAVSLMLGELNIGRFTPDSFQYMALASIAEGPDGINTASSGLLERRGFAYPYLLALAFKGEKYNLISLGPLMAVSGLMSLGWFGWRLQRAHQVSRLVSASGIAGSIGLVGTNNRFIFSAFYINGHMVFAVWLGITVGVLLLTYSEQGAAERRALLIACVPVVFALSSLRPEAGLVLALVLLPVLTQRERFVESGSLFVSLGIALLVWQGLMLGEVLSGGFRASLVVLGMSCLGVVSVGVGTCLLKWNVSLPPRFLVGVHGSLWAAAAIVAYLEPHVVAESIKATAANIIYAGQWGWSLMFLVPVVLVVFTTRRFQSMVFATFPLVSFVPLALILASVREGGAYRVGAGDSFNRMLIHFSIVVGITLAAALMSHGAKRPWKLVEVER